MPQIPDHPYRILITGSVEKLFNLRNQQPDIDKIYLYAKDPYEAIYQFVIKKLEYVGTKHYNDSKAFIEYSNDMDDIYKTYNPNVLNNKKINPIVTELFIRSRKLNISLVFIAQSYFGVPKILGYFLRTILL